MKGKVRTPLAVLSVRQSEAATMSSMPPHIQAKSPCDGSLGSDAVALIAKRGRLTGIRADVSTALSLCLARITGGRICRAQT